MERWLPKKGRTDGDPINVFFKNKHFLCQV